MPKFVIERFVPGTDKLTAEQHQNIARKSCAVLREMGTGIQWLQSYFTDDRIYCVYNAPNAEMVREHARRSGFPADIVGEVHAIVDPTTAE